MLPHAGQAAICRSWRHKQRSGPRDKTSGGRKQNPASARLRRAIAAPARANIATHHLCRSGLPLASGSLFMARRMTSISHQTPQPPSVTSFRIPSPTYPGRNGPPQMFREGWKESALPSSPFRRLPQPHAALHANLCTRQSLLPAGLAIAVSQQWPLATADAIFRVVHQLFCAISAIHVRVLTRTDVEAMNAVFIVG